jgi:MFS family permease
MSIILQAHSLESIRTFAFSSFAIATFISPLFVGALSDRNISPVKAMRWNAIGAAISIFLVGVCIKTQMPRLLVLATIFIHALFYAPAWGIASTIVLTQLTDVPKQFGSIRAMATIGWMAGCWIVSILCGDGSHTATFASAVGWLFVALLTKELPLVEPPKTSAPLKWYEQLGLDSLKLLKNRDHLMIYLTGTLFCIPVAAFYPFTPLHLRSLGLEHASGWMTLGQVSEVFAMFTLSWILSRIRIKWIIAAGLFFGVLRFLLCSWNTVLTVLGGIFLHGVSLTYVTITAQVYVDQRVNPGWRARAQSLLTVMNSGVGNLTGYFFTSWWYSFCMYHSELGWHVFWLGIASFMVGAFIFFVLLYHGLGKGVKAITPAKVSIEKVTTSVG